MQKDKKVYIFFTATIANTSMTQAHTFCPKIGAALTVVMSSREKFNFVTSQVNTTARIYTGMNDANSAVKGNFTHNGISKGTAVHRKNNVSGSLS